MALRTPAILLKSQSLATHKRRALPECSAGMLCERLAHTHLVAPLSSPRAHNRVGGMLAGLRC